MPYRFLLSATEGPVGIITLNRPQRRNALSLELMRELIECLDGFAADSDIRAIILAAEGKVFSSGHDLSEMVGRDRHFPWRVGTGRFARRSTGEWEIGHRAGRVGLPGAVDGYQVNFRVPADAVKGLARIELSAAGVAGTPVNITIQ